MSTIIFGQDVNSVKLDWSSPLQYGLEGKLNQKTLNFAGASYDFSTNKIPFFVERMEGKVLFGVRLENIITENVSLDDARLIDKSL